MHEDRLLDIRIKLARLMGATNERIVPVYPLSGPVQLTIFDPPPGVETNFWISEYNKKGLKAGTCYVPIDPVSSVEDKDTLIKWLASDWQKWEKFHSELWKLVVERLLSDMGLPPDASITAPSHAAMLRLFFTLSNEDIFMAAARSLGIDV